MNTVNGADNVPLTKEDGGVSITNFGSRKRVGGNNATTTRIYEDDLNKAAGEATLKTIHDLMSHYDKNHDGALGPEEILEMHNELLKGQKQATNLKQLILVLFIVLCLSVAANFGTSVIANNVTTEASIKNNQALTSTLNPSNVVSTAQASVTFPLYLVPVVGVKILDRIHHLQFTAIGVNMTSGPFIGVHPSLRLGFDVESYQYYSNKSVLLLGTGSERLLIDSGKVTAWGFYGMDTSTTTHVCPGSTDNSEAKCAMLRLDEIDVKALEKKATELGITEIVNAHLVELHEKFVSYSQMGQKSQVEVEVESPEARRILQTGPGGRTWPPTKPPIIPPTKTPTRMPTLLPTDYCDGICHCGEPCSLTGHPYCI